MLGFYPLASRPLSAGPIATAQPLAPPLYTNDNLFYAPTVSADYALLPLFFTDSDAVFPPTVTITTPDQVVVVALFTNANTFFSPTVTNGSIQPAQPSGSLVRPRRKFRPVVLFDLPEEKVVPPDLSAKTRLAGLSVTLIASEVVATVSNPVEVRLPKPINAKATLPFTKIETYLRCVTAESSWNDPNDEELLFILDFALS
jgi:hypothetical protein